jgi:hypothetical protein
MRPARQAVVMVAVGTAAIVLTWACEIPRRLPALVRCQLRALDVLPPDVGMVTVCDAADIWERVHECRRTYPDAGVFF